MPIKDAVIDLFSEFVRLRRSGTNRDDAWYTVADSSEADHLSQDQMKRLLNLAKQWESREGHQYRVRGEAGVDQTIVSATPLVANGTPKHSPTTMLDPSSLQALEQFAKGQTAIDLPTHEEEASTGKLADVRNVEQRQREASYFGDNSLIIFYFHYSDDVIHLRVPKDVEMVIGRSTPNSAMSPDVDLAPFDDGQYGISRMHAALKRHNDTLMIQDLGSANHTYLNDERLFPHELRMLKDGDVLSIARMLVQVRFMHK